MKTTVLAATLLFTSSLFAQNVAVIPKIGTIGAGADLAVKLSRSFDLRAGYQVARLSGEPVETDIDYEADLDLSVGNFFLDYSPGGRSFHLSAGVLSNQSSATARSTEETFLIVNGVRYRVADVGTIVGEADFEPWAPYLGFGFGNPFERARRWSIHFDVGAALVGEPDIALHAEPVNPSQELPAGFEENLRAEEEDLEEEVSGHEIIPVVTFGVGYRF